ncbi:LysR family transcriptional regulator [Tyzzerella sp. OttesenSCG-928-J15]|nr:LysR family transcriptional regulator [Tyzzerella sp. OttesenSCG-928-J15]
MNTRQMEIFINIVRYGNFSNAAKKMYLSQPAVSSNIDMLEKEVGCKLLIRQGRKASLTEQGRIFYEHCIKVMALTEDTIKTIKNDMPISGTVNLISGYVPGLYLLPRYIKNFHDNYGNIHYLLTVKNSRTAYEGVLNSKYDIGFTGSIIKNDALVYKRIFTDNMVLITPKSPEYNSLKNNLTLNDIKDMPFVMRSWGSSTLGITEKAFEKNGLKVKDLNIIAEFDSGEAVVQSVSIGLGVSIISAVCVKNNPHVNVFEIGDVEMNRDFYAIIQNNDYISPKIQKFFEFLPEV